MIKVVQRRNLSNLFLKIFFTSIYYLYIIEKTRIFKGNLNSDLGAYFGSYQTENPYPDPQPWPTLNPTCLSYDGMAVYELFC